MFVTIVKLPEKTESENLKHFLYIDHKKKLESLRGTIRVRGQTLSDKVLGIIIKFLSRIYQIKEKLS